MKRNALLLAFLVASISACGDDPAPSAGSDDVAVDAGSDAPPGTPAGDPVGQCAEDARDGMMYGRIVEVRTDLMSGEVTYHIEGEGVSWDKAAANVRVVPCP